MLLREATSKLVFWARRFFLCSSKARPCYVPMNSIELSTREAALSEISSLNLASICAFKYLSRAFGERLEFLVELG